MRLYVRKLEDCINKGNTIQIGDDIIGQAISAPLSSDEVGWPVSRIKDLTVVQSTYQLTNGVLQLPRQKTAIDISICQLSEIARTGADHRDIHDPGKRGAFDVEIGCPDTAEYPCLWKVDCKTQRSILVSPDSHAFIRQHAREKAQKILELNSRVHYNRDMGFNSHSLAVMFTEQETIGVDSIPNIVFKEKEIYDYVWTLWSNSTLGFLCYC